MNNGAYAGLRRGPRVSDAAAQDDMTPNTKPGDDDENDGVGDGKKKERKMTDTEQAAALADAEAKGFAAGSKATHERYAAVMASEHFAGRETLALKLLGNDKLSADEVIDTLSAAEAKSEPEAAGDPDAAARAEMQAALSETGNSTIAADGGNGTPTPQASADALWGKVVGKMFPGR